MKHSVAIRHVLVAAALSAGVGAVSAQGNAALDGIAKYREMLQDGNPADLFEMKGEELWKQKRGPKNASMEQCDLGKGPGVVKGAFVELPRFFKDTGKVMDLETRLIHCMVTLQGFDEAALDFCRHLTKNDPEQMGAAKIAIELVAEVGPDMARHVERMANSALMLNPAYLARIEAYVKGIGAKK